MLAGDGSITSVPVVVQDNQVRAGGSSFGLIVTLGNGASTDGTSARFTAGRSALISGHGFAAGADVEIWLLSEPQLLAVFQAEVDGTFTGTVGIPHSTPAGGHTLQAEGVAGDGIEYAVAMGVTVASAPVALPNTGGSPIWIVLVALATLSAGIIVRRQARSI